MTKTIRLGILFFGFVISTLLIWQMFVRYEAQQNWGYLPLFLFVSILGAIWCWTLRPDRSGHRRHSLLALGSACLLALGFPPLPFAPLLFVALVPLFIIQRELEDAAHPRAGRRLFQYAFTSFLLWNILSTFWVANASLAAGVFANVANALLMTIPFLCWHYCRRFMQGSITRVGLVSFWLTFEYLHHRWDLAWPWLTLGNGWARWPEMVQWYEYTGVLGGSLWILLTNIFIFRLLRGRLYNKQIRKRGIWIALLLWLIVPSGLSLWMYTQYDKSPSQNVAEVVVIQPNYEPHFEQNNVGNSRIFEEVIELAKPLMNEEVDFLILPEGTFSNYNLSAGNRDALMRKWQFWLSNYPRTQVIIGTSAYRVLPYRGEQVPEMMRFRDKAGQDVYYRGYNAAVAIQNNRDSLPVYFKSKLVAGAEFFPFQQWLGFLQPVLSPFGISIGGNGTQKKRSIFKNEDTSIGPIICYESVFGSFVRGYILQGANALTIITNDGWWDNTPGHQQHLYFARLRAIEVDRDIARSANTGVSCLINARGDLSQVTAYGEDAAFRGQIRLRNTITAYVRWGDLVGRIAGFITAILLIQLLAKAWKKRIDKTSLSDKQG